MSGILRQGTVPIYGIMGTSVKKLWRKFSMKDWLIITFIALITYSSGILASDGYIVKYKSTDFKLFSEQKIELLYEDLNIGYTKELPFNLEDIEYIEPVVQYHAFELEPVESEVQWNMTKIKAEEAWALNQGSKEVIVGIIDTGIDYTHEDIKNQMWVNEIEFSGKKGIDDDENGIIDDIYGVDFVNDDGDPMDDNSHGTHCAGIIGAAHNEKGVAGVSPNISLMGLKFLSASGRGNSVNAIKAVQYAMKHGVKILNNSWGGVSSSQAMKDVIEDASKKGILFVAASGNSATVTPMFPAAYDSDSIISVASSDDKDEISSFSNYGIPHVDIAAPGSKIESTIIGDKYAVYSGTSMACPHVAGAAALLMSQEPNLTLKEVKERILWTSDFLSHWDDVVVSSGRLNLANMLQDIRPERPLPPEEEKWVKVDFLFETPHPYSKSFSMEAEFPLPQGAKFVRVHFEKFETELKYDSFTLRVGDKTRVLSGVKKDYSKFLRAKGDTLHISFKSDKTVHEWGVKVDWVEWQ